MTIAFAHPSLASAPANDGVRPGGTTNEIERTLPPVARIPRLSEADFYGASGLIADALGLRKTPRSLASWTHGPAAWWMELKYPQQLAFHRSPLDRCLVVTREQEQFLRANGYFRAHAVGSPILYVTRLAVARRHGSLLVMPGHTLYNSEDLTPIQRYVEFVASLRRRFEMVVACLHANDIDKGHWTPALERAGIPWIRGADSYDRNSLVRVAALMQQFEYMTTNLLGSHIPYAAYFGAKVSLCGPRTRTRAEDMANVRLYQENPALLDCTLASIERYFEASDSAFIVDPWDARADVEFGARTLGVAARRPPKEVASLLGWTLPGQTELAVRSVLQRAIYFPRRAAQRLLGRKAKPR